MGHDCPPSIINKKGPPSAGRPLNLYNRLLYQLIRAAASMGKTGRGLPRMRMTMLIMKKNVDKKLNISATSTLLGRTQSYLVELYQK
jgi:hypothetical protein